MQMAAAQAGAEGGTIAEDAVMSSEGMVISQMRAARAAQSAAAAEASTEAIPHSIPATGPRVTRGQSREIQKMGEEHGCHECGAREPGRQRNLDR